MVRGISLRSLLLGGAGFLAVTAAVSLGTLLAFAVSMQREVVSRSMLMVDDQRTAQQIVIALQSQLLTADQYLIAPRPELMAEFQERGTGAYEGIRYYLFRELQPAERLLVERIKEQHAITEVLAVDVFALVDQGRKDDAWRHTQALLARADTLQRSIAELQKTRLADVDRLTARHAALTRRMYSAGVGVALLLLLSVGLLTVLLRRRLLEPLQALSTAAQRLGRGDLRARVEIRTRDELGAVAHSFNAMAAELEEAYDRAVGAEQRFHGLVQGLDAIVWEQDTSTGAFTFVSSQLREVLGYSPEAWLVDPDFRAGIVHADDWPRVQETMAQAVRGGHDYSVEYRAIAADGRELWFRDQVRVVKGADGASQFLRAVMLDTTERRRAAEQLARAEGHYRHLVEHAPTCIYSMDAEGVVGGVNPAGERILLRPAGEIVGHRLDDFVVPEDAGIARDAFARLASGSARTVEFEVRIRRETGEPASVHVITAAIYDGENMTGAHGILLDVSDRKLAEMELLRAKETAEAANRSKSEFLSSMSHELRTPLNSVIGFASVLRKNRALNLGSQELQYLERIHANGRHLLGLINDVLDLSKIEAGKMDVDLRPVSIGALVEETLGEVAGTVRDRPVELRSVVPDGVAELETDPGKLKQVLINLVGNAVKFTERGSVTVELVADPRTGAPVRLEVRDTGIGIPPERITAIFGAFEQGESGIARRYGGTGLGLAISSSLCCLMGHTLGAVSEPGAGSTFTIVFEGGGQCPSGDRSTDDLAGVAGEGAARAGAAA